MQIVNLKFLPFDFLKLCSTKFCSKFCAFLPGLAGAQSLLQAQIALQWLEGAARSDISEILDPLYVDYTRSTRTSFLTLVTCFGNGICFLLI